MGEALKDERPRLALPVALEWQVEKVKEQHRGYGQKVLP